MLKKDKEIIRKWLKSYRLNVKELNARAEHIKWLREEIFSPLAQSSNETDRHSAKRVERIMCDILSDSELRLKKLKWELETMENEIYKLDDYERCVIYNRYILGIPWLDLPEKVGYEIAQCQRIERKALEHLAASNWGQKVLNKCSATAPDKPIDNLTFSKCAPIV